MKKNSSLSRPLYSVGGFILPATLFVLAAILIAIGWYASWTSTMLNKAGQQADAAQFEQDWRSTFAILMYNISLGETSTRGMLLPEPPVKTLVEPQTQTVLSPIELAFDDTCYNGVGEVRFSIQDENGLVGVNRFSPVQLRRLLSLMGVDLKKLGWLIDTLKDYHDTDTLKHLNGAEEQQYKRAGREGPANSLFLNPTELYNVLGWDKHTELWVNSDFRNLITINTSGIPNLNVAPKQALLTIPTINNTVATNIVEKRKNNGYTSLATLEAAIGQSIGIDPFGLSFYSSYYYRVKFWHSTGGTMREIHMKRTPMADKQQPWVIDYEIIPSIPLGNYLKPCETVEEIFSN